ncbi:hypothetical protein GCM10011529_11640 [Polymorphobacter glacialis]|uniref:Cell envelope biogenesis protein TolA n=1 Tax=Sandarakinorhabdus glacialis TaxID=1614636 RepID=A0A916ZPV4_9SPHN|nr:hypothetical protein [Polymorphobacter glacialis]GGE06938.1 hypothetical protein GCM10011529_11640 [Polymorphobacter glacialis]
MTERRALLAAAAAHIILFAALSIGWQFAPKPLAPAEEMIPVDFVDIADVPRVTEAPKPSMKAAPQETVTPEPAPVEPEPTPEPTPAPTDAVPLPEPKTEPKPVPTKPAPPKPVPPKPEPAKKPAPEKPRESKPLDTSVLSNLIDKALPKARVKPLDTSDLAKSIGVAAPKQARIDPRAAATLAQAIQAQVAPCWNPPIGGTDVRKMTVVIRADYARDGSVIGQPTVVSQTGTSTGNSDYSRAFAETARRAVLRCQPLKLPANLYDLWKSVEINFDPESMT